MNLQQKIKKVADATRGMKGLFQAELIHKEGCPARSTENIISCICDFEVTVKRKNSGAEKRQVSNRLAKRINEKSKKDIRH